MVRGQISSNMTRREFSIFITFSDAMHIHVLILFFKFELISIKFGFFMNFYKLFKNRVKDPVL